MAKIHGIIYLIIGIVLTIVSSVVNNAQNTKSMTLFIYLGYLFIAIGAAKLIIGYVLKKDKNEKNTNRQLPDYEQNLQNDPKTYEQYRHQKEQRRSHQAETGGRPDLYGYIGYCPTCNTPMRRINIYCHRCGKKQ